VYNTNAYDSIASLRELDSIVDIYLPDLKYASDIYAMKYSQAPNYVAHSRQAIKEMYRQVGDLIVDDNGLAQRGLIVRHLILPNELAGSADSLLWLSCEVSTSVTVSIMSQYYPCHHAPRVPLLSRKISVAEYQAVVKVLDKLGLENGWVQELDSPENYLPDFNRDGHPFANGNPRKLHNLWPS
jgi:putative pyruvate formate lyase activating enzyme